jgi:hypothetical protein
MKRLITATLFLSIGLTGCANHFYQVKESLIHIYLEKPEAYTVSFASSEDGYKLRQAKKIDSRTWLVTMPVGLEFTYFYVIDGIAYVPSCRFKEKDDFGSENCVFIPDM